MSFTKKLVATASSSSRSRSSLLGFFPNRLSRRRSTEITLLLLLLLFSKTFCRVQRSGLFLFFYSIFSHKILCLLAKLFVCLLLLLFTGSSGSRWRCLGLLTSSPRPRGIYSANPHPAARTVPRTGTLYVRALICVTSRSLDKPALCFVPFLMDHPSLQPGVRGQGSQHLYFVLLVATSFF